MHLDCNLIWKPQIDKLIQKTEFDLLHVKKIITYCKCKNFAYGLFCTFLFTNQVWYFFGGGGGSSSSMSNFFIIQKTAIRIMLRLDPRRSCRKGFKKFDIHQQCLMTDTLVLKNHTHKYSSTDPSPAQAGMNVEFVMKTAKLQYSIKSNK